MPPWAKTAAVLCVLLAPACLCAQTPTWGSSACQQPQPTGDRPLAEDQRSKRPLGGPPSNLSQQSSGAVVPAVYQSPPADAKAELPLSPPGRGAPLPLAPPGRSSRSDAERTDGMSAAITVVGGLALVLGIFLAAAWCMRRAAPAGAVALPSGVFEVLGRASMAARQHVYLLRCGNKLVLVSVTPAGAETLTEITDPVEVDHLAGLCRQAQPGSATAVFRQVFQQFAGTSHSLEDRHV